MTEKRSRTRRGAEYWQAQVGAWRESKATMREYCRDKGIAPVRLEYWRKKIEERESETAKNSFVELIVPPERRVENARTFDIVCGTLRVVIQEDIAHERLLAILKGLRG